MSSDDNLDFELFGIPNVNELEIPLFGEFEYPDTTSYTPQTPLSLPLYVDPPLSEGHPTASSLNLDVTTDGYTSFSADCGVNASVQVSNPEAPTSSLHVFRVAVSSYNSTNDASNRRNASSSHIDSGGSTHPNDISNSLKPPLTQQPANHSTIFVNQSHDYGSGSHIVAQNPYLNVAQPSTSSRASAGSSHHPLSDGVKGVDTARVRQTVQPSPSSSHDPLLYETRKIKKKKLVPAAQSSTSSASPYPLPHGLKKPGSHRLSTSALKYPLPNDTSELKATKSRKTARAPSLPSPSSSISEPGYNAPIDLTQPINKEHPSVSFQNPSSYGATPGPLIRGQPSASSLHNALGTAGLNTVGSIDGAQPSTSSVRNPLPSNSSTGYNSPLDWNAIYGSLGIGWNDLDYNVNTGLDNTNDMSIPSHTQSTNYDSSCATEPQDCVSNPDFCSQNITQGTFTNVPQPPAFSAQHSPAPSINANALITSHAQSQSTNPDALDVTHYGYNQESDLQNKAQRRFTSVTQLSTSSLETDLRQYMAGSLPTTQSFVPFQHSVYNYPELYDNSSFGGWDSATSDVNTPDNLDKFSTVSRKPDIQENAVLEFDVSRSLDNRDIQGMYTNLNFKRSGVAYNQRSIVPPNQMSTTGYNANAIVPNVEAPPTSGVPSVDLVNQQILYPTPPPYTVPAQGETYHHYPPFNIVPSHTLFPDAGSYTRPNAVIPVPAFPVSAAQSTPMQTTHTLSRSVCMLPSPPNFDEPSNSNSSRPTSSVSATSTRTKRKRNDDDTDSTINARRAKKRGSPRPDKRLYEETSWGEFRCLYAGPAQPQGCTDPPLATLATLSRHIRTQHARYEVNMNISPDQRVAFNGLPPSLRTVLASCPLAQEDLLKCKYARENGGQRWRVRSMETAEQAVKHHIKSDHNPE